MQMMPEKSSNLEEHSSVIKIGEIKVVSSCGDNLDVVKIGNYIFILDRLY